MKLSNALSLVSLAAALTVPVPAAAAEGEEVLVDRPWFSDADEEESSSTFGPLASANVEAEAQRAGTIDLVAEASATNLVLSYNQATAQADGWIFGEEVEVDAGGYRVEAMLSLEAVRSVRTDASATPLGQAIAWDGMSVVAAVDVPTHDLDEEVWNLDNQQDPSHRATWDGYSERTVADSLIVSRTFRVGCGSERFRAGVAAHVLTEARSPNLGFSWEHRSQRLHVAVSEIRIRRLPGLGCVDTTTIEVRDDAFTPAQVVLAKGDAIRFDWTQAANEHHVVVDGPFGNVSGIRDEELLFEEAGVFDFWCAIHGGPREGMAGTITVA